MKISTISTKSRQTIPVKKVTVLVGPNNSGKSQTLKDILNAMAHPDIDKVLITRVDFEFEQTFEKEIDGLRITESKRNIGSQHFEGIQYDLSKNTNFDLDLRYAKQRFDNGEKEQSIVPTFSQARVAYLNSSTRLNLVTQSKAFDPQESYPSNILQSLFLDKESEKVLRGAFKTAFGMDIKLDYSKLITFCLRIAQSMPVIPEDPQEAVKITGKLAKIDDQGDGFKSFAGIVLGLLLSRDRVILLDEPEAFLHPTQARYLGKWIADNIDHFSGQLIISTHNANFLSGLLAGGHAVDIYRLNRSEDDTQFNQLSPAVISKLFNDPILSSQRVLEAIFHQGVIIGEADSDRSVYSSVASLEHGNQDILFIHAHNKQTLEKVAALLKGASVPVAVIADIDLLNTENDFIKLYELLSGKSIIEKLTDMRKQIASSVNLVSEEDLLKRLTTEIAELHCQLQKGEHNLSGAKTAIERIRKSITKWSEPKAKGVEGFEPSVQPTVELIIKVCNEVGLFIVPVGELEGWIKLDVRKNKWIVQALEQIHERKSPEALKNFVKMALEFFTP